MKKQVLMAALLLGTCGAVLARQDPPTKQQEKTEFYERVEAFEKGWPTVGDRLPELTLYTPDGREVKTSSLRGHYTVLTLGCLT